MTRTSVLQLTKSWRSHGQIHRGYSTGTVFFYFNFDDSDRSIQPQAQGQGARAAQGSSTTMDSGRELMSSLDSGTEHREHLVGNPPILIREI
jgi:hypothetical protein